MRVDVALFRMCSVLALLGAASLGGEVQAQSAAPSPVYRPLPRQPAAGSRLATRLALPMRDATIEEALRALARASGLRISFGDAVITSPRRVTLGGGMQPAVEILRRILDRSSLIALVTADGSGLVLVGAGRLSGVVRDAATGAGLAAVPVWIDDVAASQTSDDGSFGFASVPSGLRIVRASVDGRTTADTVTVRPGGLVTVTLRVVGSRGQALPRVVVNGTIGPARTVRDLTGSTSLGGASLQQALGSSIAQTLASQPGVTQRYNGPAAAQPVVRGLTGNRLLVLEDGQRTGDIASTAADHAVTIEPITAQQIELISGPRGLVYGSQLLGGVINVIRDDIPRSAPSAPAGVLTSQFESANRGGVIGGSVVTPVRGAVLRLEGTVRGAGDTRTPLGILPATDLRTTNLAVSASRTAPAGYWGGTIRDYRSEYGVPSTFNGRIIPGAHLDGVYIDLQRTALRAEGERTWAVGTLAALRGEFSHVRFVQSEIERGGVVGTMFGQLTSSATILGRLRRGGRTTGTAGVTALQRDFAAAGSFTGSRSALQRGVAGFVVDEVALGRLQMQWGARYDWSGIAPRDTSPSRLLPNVRQRSFGAASGGITSSVDLGRGVRGGLSVARSFRSPAVEELYSNGPHLANYAYEIGNPSLASETAIGAEAFLRLDRRRLTAHLAAFGNDVDNFIYYQATGELDTRFRRYPVFRANQSSAALRGGELRVRGHLRPSLTLAAQASLVDARQRDGTPLPAIPPLQWSSETEYAKPRWSVAIRAEGAAAQQRVAAFELPTGAWAFASVRGSIDRTIASRVHRVTLAIHNVTDVAWRDHLSRVRAVAPQPGRNTQLAYRVFF